MVKRTSIRRRTRLACRRNRDSGAAQSGHGTQLRSAMLRPVGGTPSCSNTGEERSLSRRARQRLHRQYLAHPDDQDGQGHAAQPEVAAKLKEFKVVSTGEDVAAQIAAINNFIDSGYDAIVVNAQNPAAFKPVIKRANDAGVVLVAFDNILDTEEAINVNVDQKGLGEYWAEWLVKHVPNGGKILEVRGVSGTSVDRDRHEGIHEVLKARARSGKWSK